jgi:large subunit ribosomal protein L1
MKIGKRLKESYKSFENSKLFSIEQAVKLVKSNSKAKFDETIDISMNLGVDPRQSDQMVRGMVALPSGTGKDVKVAVFAKNEKLKEATEAGAEFVGEADLAEKIESGKIEFDRVIATPDLMGTVGKLGKILGPRGLMPNPKLGTVTMDVTKAIKAAKSGEVQFRVEKSGIVHAGIGKSSFDEKSIIANVNAFIKAVSIAKPSASKGVYMKKITISSTMGPGIKIDTIGVMA